MGKGGIGYMIKKEERRNKKEQCECRIDANKEQITQICTKIDELFVESV